VLLIKNRKKIFLTGFFLLTVLSCSLFAASQAIVTVSPQQATIGDPVTVQITVPGGDPEYIEWPDFSSGTIGELHILSIDTLSGRELKKVGGASLKLQVAAFDTGSFTLGPLTIKTPGGEQVLPEKKLQIVSVLSDSTGTEYNPFKAQEDLKVTFSDIVRWVLPWLLVVIVLLAAYFLIRKWLKKRKGGEEEFEEPPLPPYEEAVTALANLKISNPLKHGDVKTYVSELAFIIKRLLERSHDNPVLEMTTGEVRKWVRKTSLRCPTTKLIELLELGDRVKFAKGVLDGQTSDKLFCSAEDIILDYKPLPEVEVDKKVEEHELLNENPEKKMEKLVETELQEEGGSER